jgi:cytochrome c-type biogenesis protein CcmF
MTILLGNIALMIAVIASAVGLLSTFAAGRLSQAGPLRVARWSLGTVWAMFSLASIMLIAALMESDFRLNYVARYTEKALPAGYKLAAFWAGQEGSLLLWAWLLAGMSITAAFVRRRKNDSEEAGTLGVLGVICGFFAMLLLQAANPFQVNADVPADGQGLNPMLQDPGMIAHPPLLFLGYAGCAIPFAMMFGALLSGRRDSAWIAGIRRWLLIAWLFLTVGILLGAQWAYVELGWGGYWAWDPVENASLLPWLTTTALLHSIMPHQQRGMLKHWNVALIGMTFALCIFGTWITRSGIVDSVHSFGKSLVGTFFFVFLMTIILSSILLILVRWNHLKSEHPIESLWGREAAFLATNLLLLIMTLVIGAGTLFPAISEGLTGRSVSVGQPFYNMVIVPMGLVLMGIMAFGPFLSYGKDAGNSLRHRVWPALAGGAVVAIALGFMRIFNPWALICGFIIGIAAVSVLSDLLATIYRRMQGLGENSLVALVRTVDLNHRRYGGQTAHVGMLMLMVGLAGSSLYNVKHDIQIASGATTRAGGWSINLQSIAEARHANFSAVEAVALVTDPAGKTITLRPQRRFYDKSEQSNSEVAISSSLARDAYLVLAGWEDGGQVVALQLLVNPLVIWLWIGGIVMTAGAVLCLLPRLMPQPSTSTHTVAHPASSLAIQPMGRFSETLP